MEHVQDEPNQSGPRLRSKSSRLPLDHRTRGDKGIRVHTHLKGCANLLSDSQDSISVQEDEHAITNTNNNVSNCNDNHSLGGGGDDNDDDGVSRNSEETSDNSDDDRGNGDKDDENCGENCDSKYHYDNGGNTSHEVEDNDGVCAKSYTIQAPLCSNADETAVGSDETAESLTEEFNVSLRFNSQHSIGEDTGNFNVENSNGSLASSNSINSNNDTSCENSNTRNDEKTSNDLQKANRFELINNAERSAERDGIAASRGARPNIVPQNPVLFDARGTYNQNGKIPSLETTGVDQNFLARHSTDPSLPQSSFTESYDMYTSNKFSNDWTQTSITSNSSSSLLLSLPCSPAPERGGLVLQNPYSRGLIPRYGDPMSGNYQPVTSVTGQFPKASNFSHEIDWFNCNENLPRNLHQTSFPSCGDFTAGNETLTASPSLGVSPSLRALRYPAVATPSSRKSFPTATSQFSSSTMSGNIAPVTSAYDVLSSYGRERVGDFSRCRPSYREDEANSGLTSPERREESFKNHDLFNNQQEGSFASVSLRDPSLVSLEQQVAEIDRILKEREERTNRQREAAQRHREIREKRQREARERKEREEREMREGKEREKREREQREKRQREEREMREKEERENREIVERELEERRKPETRTREHRIAEESLPFQGTPPWQCEHYQRRCRVKFPCCGEYYPCHRCHNLSGTCPADDKKAHHATHVKCGNCGLEEEINEGSQTCTRCGLKLSEYFCPKCKHFTGVDKNPFHCEKCKICRIYRDRSFHCDVCNVCLDKRLEGKHKCRPNSGHDECCICLEDAFSGCQILPCSHKVHRECAIAMVQNGIRNCPICRHPLYGQLQQ